MLECSIEQFQTSLIDVSYVISFMNSYYKADGFSNRSFCGLDIKRRGKISMSKGWVNLGQVRMMFKLKEKRKWNS